MAQTVGLGAPGGSRPIDELAAKDFEAARLRIACRAGAVTFLVAF
jgi:hypothetical protein